MDPSGSIDRSGLYRRCGCSSVELVGDVAGSAQLVGMRVDHVSGAFAARARLVLLRLRFDQRSFELLRSGAGTELDPVGLAGGDVPFSRAAYRVSMGRD